MDCMICHQKVKIWQRAKITFFPDQVSHYICYRNRHHPITLKPSEYGEIMDLSDTIEFVKKSIASKIYTNSEMAWNVIFRRATYASAMNIKLRSVVSHEDLIISSMLYGCMTMTPLTVDKIAEMGWSKDVINTSAVLSNMAKAPNYWESLDLLTYSNHVAAMIIALSYQYDDSLLLPKSDTGAYGRIEVGIRTLTQAIERVIGVPIDLPQPVSS